MWYSIKCELPYSGDFDYRLALIASVKSALNTATVDVTLLETYGILEIDTDDAGALAVSKLPMIGKIKASIDREMLAGPRIYI